MTKRIKFSEQPFYEHPSLRRKSAISSPGVEPDAKKRQMMWMKKSELLNYSVKNLLYFISLFLLSSPRFWLCKRTPKMPMKYKLAIIKK